MQGRMDGRGRRGGGGTKKAKRGPSLSSRKQLRLLSRFTLTKNSLEIGRKGDEEVKDGGGLHGDAPFKETAANAD